MQFNDLPLDCLRLIASKGVNVYRRLLIVKKFALSTLGADNIRYRRMYTVCEEVGDLTYYRLRGQIHRDDDLPAVIDHHNGNKYWFQFNQLHRDRDLPALMERAAPIYYSDYPGSMVKYITTYIYINGMDGYSYDYPHVKATRSTDVSYCDNDPVAICAFKGRKIWYKWGKSHRDNDKPAMIHFDDNLEWFVDGKRHRDHNRPAKICTDGTFEWWQQSRPHRDDDQPAIIMKHDDNRYCKLWYRNGVLQKRDCSEIDYEHCDCDGWDWNCDGYHGCQCMTYKAQYR
jgi:hypothetical protein